MCVLDPWPSSSAADNKSGGLEMFAGECGGLCGVC